MIYLSNEKIKLFLEIIDEEKIDIDIMDDGSDFISDDSDYHSAISIGILMKKDIDIIKLLCIPHSTYETKNEIINSNVHGRCGMTILMLSIVGTLSKDIIFYLLENGADPLQEDDNGDNSFRSLELSNYCKNDKKEIFKKMDDIVKTIGKKRKKTII